MVSQRRGLSSMGCLFTLLVLAVAVYFGMGVGEQYFNFYQYQDAMHQEVRFAAHNPDAVILQHLRDAADSLSLPEAAAEVTVQRDGHHISIESEYYVHIELPLVVREKRFNPHAEGVF